MKHILIIIVVSLFSNNYFSHTKTIHIFVALCDNESQGIVPVPSFLGDGQDPKNNLYWGAAYGVKSFFKHKTKDWILVDSPNNENDFILERVLFKHISKDIYLLADGYDGKRIKDCTMNFLKASNGQEVTQIEHDNTILNFGGGSDLVAYIGHDGLMDFDVEIEYNALNDKNIDVMILACYSKSYFSSALKKAKANPILWTTHLMSPEAYTIKAAIDGWMLEETGKEIEERAAQAYNQYQKCGIRGARNLFTTGY